MKTGDAGIGERLRRRLRITTRPQALRASFAGGLKLIYPSLENMVPDPPGWHQGYT